MNLNIVSVRLFGGLFPRNFRQEMKICSTSKPQTEMEMRGRAEVAASRVLLVSSIRFGNANN